MVYVWHVHDPGKTAVYALTYQESLTLLDKRGHTRSASWTDKGLYTLTVNPAWRERLEPYRIVPEMWAARVRRTVAATNNTGTRLEVVPSKAI